MTRTRAEIEREYTEKCARLGHNSHLRETLTLEDEVLRKRLRELNFECDAAIAEEQQKKRDEEFEHVRSN